MLLLSKRLKRSRLATKSIREHKKSNSDVTLGLNNFHQKVKNNFAWVLAIELKDAIDMCYQIAGSALFTYDPNSFLATTLKKYGGEKMEILQNYYRNPNAGNLSRQDLECDHEGLLAEYSTLEMYEHTETCKPEIKHQKEVESFKAKVICDSTKE